MRKPERGWPWNMCTHVCLQGWNWRTAASSNWKIRAGHQTLQLTCHMQIRAWTFWLPYKNRQIYSNIKVKHLPTCLLVKPKLKSLQTVTAETSKPESHNSRRQILSFKSKSTSGSCTQSARELEGWLVTMKNSHNVSKDEIEQLSSSNNWKIKTGHQSKCAAVSGVETKKPANRNCHRLKDESWKSKLFAWLQQMTCHVLTREASGSHTTTDVQTERWNICKHVCLLLNLKLERKLATSKMSSTQNCKLEIKIGCCFTPFAYKSPAAFKHELWWSWPARKNGRADIDFGRWDYLYCFNCTNTTASDAIRVGSVHVPWRCNLQ